jgi:hypothetical protein
MMEAERASETLEYNSVLMRLVARENFVEYRRLQLIE